MPFNNILSYFPRNIANIIEKYFGTHNMQGFNELEEIRLRANKPLILKLNKVEKIFEYTITSEDLLETLQHICNNSIYSYQNQICNGYITVNGGHRVGITGNVVVENNRVININYISSLNFRVSKQIIGCSNKILKYILDIENNNIFNTLIVSPPGAGKTTLLRDIIRKISMGIENANFKGISVGVVDERAELAAMSKGLPANDLGIRTDILDNIPKAIGMKMLIRSMAPKVIAADEIGSIEDVEAINYAICSGIKGIFTAHGSSLEEILLNPALESIIKLHIFERIIFLSNKGVKGDIEKIYVLNKINSEYIPM